MSRESFDDESSVEALRYGLDLGMSLIDTAEMYGAGHSEEIVSRTLADRKDPVFVASKVSPSHFAYGDVLRSAQKSLKRLRIKQIDLYQLHWPNPRIPITETMRAMEKLVNEGLIKYIGVSNFSVQQTREALQPLSKHQIVSNQVEYNLLNRSIEASILPYCQNAGITIIAYSPLAQGRISTGRGPSFRILDQTAARLGKTRSQIALGWLLSKQTVIVIPKAVSKQHLQANAETADLQLSAGDVEQLSRAFPA